MRHSISLKINLILFLVVLFLGCALGGIFIIDQRRMLHQELDRRIRLMELYLSGDFADAAARHDLPEMDRILKASVLDDEINYVMAKSPDGEILASRWTAQLRTGGVHEHTFPLRAPDIASGGGGTERFGPVDAPENGNTVGFLSIGVSLNPLQKKLSRMIAQTAAAVLLGIVVAIAAGWWLVSALFQRSIAPLLFGIATIGSGDLSRRITPDRHDELGRIGRAFNEMAERLSSTLISKERLEAAVDQRTAELTTVLEERSAAQAALAEREERIRLLLNSTAEAIYGIEPDGACTFCNSACVRMLGYERPEDLIGKDMHSLIHHSKTDGSPYAAEECPIYASVRTGKGHHAPNEVFWKADGSSMHVEYWSYPVFQEKKLLGAVVTFLDLTERLKLEQQLFHSQKMEAIGLLAGGVAHDFNNILTAIIGYGNIMQMKMKPDDPLLFNVAQMIASADRAAQLTRSLLAFSRKQSMQMKPARLNEIIARQEKLLRMIIGEDIEIKTVLRHEVVVMADSSQIEQVLMNLATNARDAMPQGGSLTFETDLANITEAFVNAHGFGTPGAYALVSVTDTGVGMDAGTQQKIFDPFFTTKEVGRGTGLGMAIIYGIVKQHKGYINVYSQVGRGTTIKIYLPLRHDQAGQQTSPQSAAPAPRGDETILLAEDDQTLRTFFKDLLTGHGYTVIVAENGEEAVKKFADQKDAIQLAVVDVIMPKMSGKEAYDAIQKIKPGIKVIFSSGYTADKVQQEGLPPGSAFIGKPVVPQEYLYKIRRVLDDN
ncbi:MAG TPA: ATP-binding protein [Nitrospirota bacterium]